MFASWFFYIKKDKAEINKIISYKNYVFGAN